MGRLDEQYSPSSCVEDYEALIDDYRELSRRARLAHPPETHTYGPDPGQRLDVFRARPGTTAHVFVHGGYWQELGKDDSSFPAAGFVPAGITYVAVGYGLAPRLGLDDIVGQVRTALTWLYEHGHELGIDPGRIVLSGSSAGAHLAVMAAMAASASVAGSAPSDAPPRTHGISGLVLLSGVYELTPLLDTYVNDALGLDRAAARRNSPARLVAPAAGAAPIPTVIAWGEHETDAFKRQSADFAEAWRGAGHPVWSGEIAGRNHFDLVHDLADPGTTLGAQVARLHSGASAR